MSKTKTLVIAFSALASLAGIGVSAGTAQAQTRSDRASIAVGEVNRALDRAEYTSFKGGHGGGRHGGGWGHGRRWGHGHGWGHGWGFGHAGYYGGYYGGCYLKKFITYDGDIIFKKVCY